MSCRAVAVAATIAATMGCGAGPAPPGTPPPEPVYTARVLRDITVPRTAARVDRGRYLAEGLLQCFVCHSERDWTQPGAPPIAPTKGAGAVWPGTPWLVAPNLTPDVETGIGRWTDDMLLRAIREGISHDGRTLHPQMWYASFRALPDEDAEAVVAYLRSLKPIRRVLPATAIPPDRAATLKVPKPITAPVAALVDTDPVQHGRKLAMLADCAGCHTSWYTPNNPGLFAGGNHIERGPVQAWSPNLTSDPSGIPHYDGAFFREVMRAGRARGRELNAIMPWIAYRNLTDADLDALFAYLRAIRPARHVIDNIAPNTACAICGGEHPLGEYNRPVPRRLVDYPLSLVRDALGTYRFDDGFEMRLVILKGVFSLQFADGDSCSLVTEDRRTFFCDGDIDYLEFVRDVSGAVTHIVNNRTDKGLRMGR